MRGHIIWAKFFREAWKSSGHPYLAMLMNACRVSAASWINEAQAGRRFGLTLDERSRACLITPVSRRGMNAVIRSVINEGDQG